VSLIDSVGTKVKVAAMTDRYDTVGIDMVNHCINDILVMGARPLFFMDYIATSKLRPHTAADLVKGMSEACREAGCALLGGEIAEMPGSTSKASPTWPGASSALWTERGSSNGSRVQQGDVVIGLASTACTPTLLACPQGSCSRTTITRSISRSPSSARCWATCCWTPHKSYLKSVSAVMSPVRGPRNGPSHRRRLLRQHTARPADRLPGYGRAPQLGRAAHLPVHPG